MISFIVIGKNEGWKLRQCFDSILASVCKNQIKDFEILYIDSQSEDESIQIAKESGIIRIFQIEGFCNAAIARNIGGMEANGEILVFLDGDMELKVDFLYFVLKNGELVYPFITGLYNYCYYGKNNEILKEQVLNDKRTSVYANIPGGFFIISKSLWLSCRGMDERLSVNEDYDLGLRLCHNMPLKQISEVCINHYTYTNKLWFDFWKIIFSYRYTSVLTKKHFWNRCYYLFFLRSNYTSVMLLISIGLSLLNYYWTGLYVLAVLLRSFKNRNKSSAKMILFYTIRDLVIIMSLLLYYPRTPKISYSSLANK